MANAIPTRRVDAVQSEMFAAKPPPVFAGKLKAHHLGWLQAHPDRSIAWLKAKLLEGFDVHHVDGDHGNNEPLNLVLMEAADHLRMHGPRLKDGIGAWRRSLGRRTAELRRIKERDSVVQPAADLDEMSVRAYLSRAGNRRAI